MKVTGQMRELSTAISGAITIPDQVGSLTEFAVY